MHAVDGHAFGQLFQLGLGDIAERPGPIAADHAGLGQLQLPFQLAVVGQQQQPFGV